MFATDGFGLVREQGDAEVFRLLPDERDERPGVDVDGPLLDALRAFRGLPFARRQLAAFPRDVLERGLAALLVKGELTAYPPLAEKSGRPVAQAEHTVYIGPEGVEVLTG